MLFYSSTGGEVEEDLGLAGDAGFGPSPPPTPSVSILKAF
jgi:hypothetical protein